MAMPEPRPGESQDAFIIRFADDPGMKARYRLRHELLSMAYGVYRGRKRNAREPGSQGKTFPPPRSRNE